MPIILQQNFTVDVKANVIVADLTYIKVGQKWNYLCVLLELSTRKIGGFSVKLHKIAELVMQALSQIKVPLSSNALFHSPGRKEFDNQSLDSCIEVLDFIRSLSNKGCPYNNTVAEAIFKIIKTEFVQNKVFTDIMNLDNELKQ